MLNYLWIRTTDNKTNHQNNCETEDFNARGSLILEVAKSNQCTTNTVIYGNSNDQVFIYNYYYNNCFEKHPFSYVKILKAHPQND